MIVVDASALVDVITSWRSASLEVRLIEAPIIHVPVTIDAEVLHALRRQTFTARFRPEHATRALALLAGIALTRHPVQPLADRMWALRHNITSYDAAYVALAESLSLPLLTRDARLSRASGHAATIEYID